ncbi:MAG: hypothetical protein WB561_21520 [Terracidiphilus sp.]
MTSDPIVLSAIVGASFSFLAVGLFNLAREAHRRISEGQRSRKDEAWE